MIGSASRAQHDSATDVGLSLFTQLLDFTSINFATGQDVIFRFEPERCLGLDAGLKQSCCANLASLFTVRQSDLKRYVGAVGSEKMRQVRRALVIACGCD